MQIAEALRLLRTRKGLTQIAASKRKGAPDFRTLSHWENQRKLPSFKLLYNYLASLNLDFRDLQAALDQVEGKVPKRLQDGLERLDHRVGEIEQQLGHEPINSPTKPPSSTAHTATTPPDPSPEQTSQPPR